MNIQTTLLHTPEPKPIIPYFGSKASQSPWIWQTIDRLKQEVMAQYSGLQFTTHSAPFGGDFRHLIYPDRIVSVSEFYNDLNEDNIHLLIQLRDNVGAVLDWIEAEVVSESNFRRWEGMLYPDKWKEQNPGVDVPMPNGSSHRAACYLLFGKFCFNYVGTRNSTGLSRSKLEAGRKPDASALFDVSDRLQGVCAHNDDYRVHVEKLCRWCRGIADMPVFIWDPPYPAAVRNSRDSRHINGAPRRQYKHELMAEADHQEICETILNSPGLHVLCGYEYGLYSSMLGKVVDSRASQDGAGKPRRECLWSTFVPHPKML